MYEKFVFNRESLAPSQNLIHKSKWFITNEIIFSQKMLSYWGGGQRGHHKE